MKGVRRCGVVEDKKRCKHLAFRSIKGEWICSIHYRRIKNEILIEHVLGKTEREAKASMENALKTE